MNKSEQRILAAERRSKVAELYLKSKTQAEIAEELGISQQAVSKHLKILTAGWIKSAECDFEKAKAIELAKINSLEATYHEAWERSCVSRKDTMKEKGTGLKETTKARVNIISQNGDEKFLNGVLKCITKRCEIMGLNAPTKLSATTPDGKHPAEGLGLVGLLREAERLEAEELEKSNAGKADERCH